MCAVHCAKRRVKSTIFFSPQENPKWYLCQYPNKAHIISQVVVIRNLSQVSFYFIATSEIVNTWIEFNLHFILRVKNHHRRKKNQHTHHRHQDYVYCCYRLTPQNGWIVVCMMMCIYKACLTKKYNFLHFTPKSEVEPPQNLVSLFPLLKTENTNIVL